jgi:hypothetical protein
VLWSVSYDYFEITGFVYPEAVDDGIQRDGFDRLKGFVVLNGLNNM